MKRPQLWWERVARVGTDDAIINAIIQSTPCECGDCIIAKTALGDVCLRSFYTHARHNALKFFCRYARKWGPKWVGGVLFQEPLYKLKTVHQAWGAGKHEGEREVVAQEVDA